MLFEMWSRLDRQKTEIAPERIDVARAWLDKDQAGREAAIREGPRRGEGQRLAGDQRAAGASVGERGDGKNSFPWSALGEQWAEILGDDRPPLRGQRDVRHER